MIELWRLHQVKRNEFATEATQIVEERRAVRHWQTRKVSLETVRVSPPVFRAVQHRVDVIEDILGRGHAVVCPSLQECIEPTTKIRPEVGLCSASQ